MVNTCVHVFLNLLISKHMISSEYKAYKLKPILGLMFGIYPIFLKISTIS